MQFNKLVHKIPIVQDLKKAARLTSWSNILAYRDEKCLWANTTKNLDHPTTRMNYIIGLKLYITRQVCFSQCVNPRATNQKEKKLKDSNSVLFTEGQGETHWWSSASLSLRQLRQWWQVVNKPNTSQLAGNSIQSDHPLQRVCLNFRTAKAK